MIVSSQTELESLIKALGQVLKGQNEKLSEFLTYEIGTD
ncbi:MAG: hypothetical protein KatS3mg006_0482 [Pyrinomonadaceae bacterium]|jgi:hypothetical protein|nr:MAG: hypothetical protein KatS3mg006_0482 [Pyrinomonadaceae bacterium]